MLYEVINFELLYMCMCNDNIVAKIFFSNKCTVGICKVTHVLSTSGFRAALAWWRLA